MKVILLGAKGDFTIENKGLGIQAYMYQMANRFKRVSEIDITLSESNPLPVFGNSLSFFISNSFKDFSKFDIVHSLDVKPFMPIIKSGAVWIATVHDFWPILYPNSYIGDETIKNYAYNAILRWGLRLQLKADFLIAISTTTRDIAIKKFGYPKKNIKVINLGLSEKFLHVNNGKIYKSEKKFIIGYIGAFRPNKNVNFTLESFKLLRYTKDIKFKIYGDKNFEYEKLKKKAAGYKNIYFKGFLPESQKVATYKSFDCFVFPSLYEGFGLPILEAQACGLPVIIYKKGKIPKEVRKYCFEAESPEHMAQIIENLKENGYNEKLQRKATEYVRSFTWDKCARETFKIYNRFKK